MKDSFNRQVDYLRLSVTDRCNLRCTYCAAAEPFHFIPHERILRLEEMARLVEIAISLGINKIRLTGGEPLLRKGLMGLVHSLSDLTGIADLSLTTNGILLAPMAKDLRQAGLRRINISLDSMDADRFRALTGGGDLAVALAGLDAAFVAGLQPIKINAVVHPHTPFELPVFERLIREKPVVVRFIARMNLAQYHHDVESNAWTEKLGETLLRHGFEPDTTTIGFGPATHYRHPNYAGAFGIISHRDGHACEQCNRLRLTADGRLKPCLFCGETISVFSALRENAADETVADCLRSALAIKPKCGSQNVQAEGRTMREIGG